MTNIRMIATDIDGTILPSGRNLIPERVLNALAEALRRGIAVVPASGRLLSAIPRELMELPGLPFAISCNGASVTDLHTGECIYDRRIPEGRAAELLEKLTHYDVYTCVYLPEGAFNWDRIHPGLWKTYPNRIDFFSQNRRNNLAEFVEKHGQRAEKIFVAVFDQKERDRIRREFAEFTDIHVTSSSRWNLEINHAGADKGQALAWLARRRGLRAEQVLAMGDNENDFTMLTYAGTVIVPENATEVIKRLATEIVPPCEEAGTAVYLEKLLGWPDLESGA